MSPEEKQEFLRAFAKMMNLSIQQWQEDSVPVSRQELIENDELFDAIVEEGLTCILANVDGDNCDGAVSLHEEANRADDNKVRFTACHAHYCDLKAALAEEQE